MDDLQAHRSFYARYVVASAGSSNERLINAFASIAREKFLGQGPWPISTATGYLATISADPRHIYHDVVVGLVPEKSINNGQPTLHAKCLDAIAPADGETVVHVGAGSGYYTALLADMVGPSGQVHAYEIEPQLSDRGARVLNDYRQVLFNCNSAIESAIPMADVIYVNAGLTSIPDHWLDALKPGGRLLAPLTPNEGFGGMLLVRRMANESFGAQIVARVGFIPCSGGRTDTESNALAQAFETKSIKAVRSLRRHATPDESSWYVTSHWWLSTAEPQA
jgi:protein-L-isoaspartate(D-aspartate) O-methyltransferase